MPNESQVVANQVCSGAFVKLTEGAVSQSGHTDREKRARGTVQNYVLTDVARCLVSSREATHRGSEISPRNPYSGFLARPPSINPTISCAGRPPGKTNRPVWALRSSPVPIAARRLLATSPSNDRPARARRRHFANLRHALLQLLPRQRSMHRALELAHEVAARLQAIAHLHPQPTSIDRECSACP